MGSGKQHDRSKEEEFCMCLHGMLHQLKNE